MEQGRELEPVSKNELRALFPDRENVNIGGVGILGITTNLIAYRSPDNQDSSKRFRKMYKKNDLQIVHHLTVTEIKHRTGTTKEPVDAITFDKLSEIPCS